MIFAEKTEVYYKGMFGMIDFVCEHYIVVQLPAASLKHNSPRLLVYPQSYKEIEIAKSSTKQIDNVDSLVREMNGLIIQPNTSVLVLNSSYEPIHITNWKRAVVLLLKEKAQALSNRVIRLVNYVKLPLSRILSTKPSRQMIYKRDNHTCQYCGSTSRLTIDHVIPRCRGGEDTWENLVVACSSCNTKKGNTLLEQTNMKLARKPKAPYNKMQFALNHCNIPEWQDYSYGSN